MEKFYHISTLIHIEERKLHDDDILYTEHGKRRKKFRQLKSAYFNVLYRVLTHPNEYCCSNVKFAKKHVHKFPEFGTKRRLYLLSRKIDIPNTNHSA